MTNDLNNFLERETQNITQYAYFVDHQSEEDLAEVVREHNTRLINFVLELVEKEVNKKPTAYFLAGEAFIRSNDIDESINSLKV